jgi:hypothetical protein
MTIIIPQPIGTDALAQAVLTPILCEKALECPFTIPQPYQQSTHKKIKTKIFVNIITSDLIFIGSNLTAVGIYMCSQRLTTTTEPINTIQIIAQIDASSDHCSELFSTYRKNTCEVIKTKTQRTKNIETSRATTSTACVIFLTAFIIQ